MFAIAAQIASERDGRLREDLYYRLNVFTISLPSLRDRRDDIPLIAQHFITEFNNKHHRAVEALRDETMDLLNTYSWPGNVREMRNVIERAVILSRGNWIEPSHLPPYIREGIRPPPSRASSMTMADAERELIIRTLEQSGNNKAETARRLSVDEND
jgi:two-component system response regulator HydG